MFIFLFKVERVKSYWIEYIELYSQECKRKPQGNEMHLAEIKPFSLEFAYSVNGVTLT